MKKKAFDQTCVGFTHLGGRADLEPQLKNRLLQVSEIQDSAKIVRCTVELIPPEERARFEALTELAYSDGSSSTESNSAPSLTSSTSSSTSMKASSVENEDWDLDYYDDGND
eukprot:702874-Rhodomonas_salina.1